MHPPYSPDLAPSDYPLFLSMANALNGEKLASREACENWLPEFFVNRDAAVYERVIMKQSTQWTNVHKVIIF